MPKDILVVEPDQTARETEAAMLQALGYKVTATTNIDEALVAFRAGQFKLVLTETEDVLDGGGVDFLSDLRLSGQEPVPVVILGASVSTLPQDVAAMRQAGFADIWRKPIGVNDLREAIAALVGQS